MNPVYLLWGLYRAYNHTLNTPSLRTNDEYNRVQKMKAPELLAVILYLIEYQADTLLYNRQKWFDNC